MIRRAMISALPAGLSLATASAVESYYYRVEADES
jgi:hypothetical protein